MPGFGGEFKEHTWEEVWEVCACGSVGRVWVRSWVRVGAWVGV